MKILLTSDWYTPAINGVVTSVQNLRTGLQARGHDVRILTLSQSVHRQYTADGVSYLSSIAAGKVYPGARLRALPSPRIRQSLLNWSPDLIHSNCEFSTFHPALTMAANLNIPLVHTYHTVYEDYTHYLFHSPQVGRQIVRTMTRFVAGRVDCLIAPSEKTARLLRSYHIETPIHVVPTGIDFSKLAPAPNEDRAALRQRLGIPPEHIVLACIGRLAREKNAEELLNFLTRLLHLPITLLLVGGGPYQKVLQEEAERLQLGNRVVFTGMIPPSEIGAYYRAGDLFVSASTSETQGLTYLEALACGLPLLCRADSCLETLITQGVDGWQYHNEAEFVHYLLQFIETPLLRQNLQQQALHTAAHYSIAQFAQQMEEIYAEQIAHQRHTPRNPLQRLGLPRL